MRNKPPNRRFWKTVLWGSGVILVACLVVITGLLSVAVSVTWIYLLASCTAAAFATAAILLGRDDARAAAEEADSLVASAEPDSKGFLASLDVDDD
jgi:hypothetical protein